MASIGGNKVRQVSQSIGKHAGKNGNWCGCSVQSRRISQLTLDVEHALLAASKIKTFQKSIFHCWKMEKWIGQCKEKISDQDAKKGEVNGTYHLWKPEVGKSIELLPQYLCRTTVKYSLAGKIEQKEEKLILCSGKGKTSEFHTWIWCEHDAGTFSASFHDSICRENSSFRENERKMIIRKNGLTNSRVPRSVKKNLFFWPALFPDAILALRHRLFLGKSLPLGRWLSCAWKY